jgi:hypothetical protein
MRTINVAVLYLYLSAIGSSLGASPGGTLAGVVVDDVGAPIPRALVFYHSVQTRVRLGDGHFSFTGSSISSSVRTAADGSFVATGLPAATYQLCAYGTRDSHLGSCEWGQGTTGVNLASDQTVNLKFVVAEGTLLTFQVEDPKHQIRDLESLQAETGRPAPPGANFAIGIWAGTRYAHSSSNAGCSPGANAANVVFRPWANALVSSSVCETPLHIGAGYGPLKH